MTLNPIYHNPVINNILTMKPGDRLINGKVVSFICFHHLYQRPQEAFSPKMIITGLVSAVLKIILIVRSVFLHAAYWCRDTYRAYQLTGSVSWINTAVVDGHEFNKIFPLLDSRVIELQRKFDQGLGTNIETFVELRHLLKIYTKLRLSWSGEDLTKDPQSCFSQFRAGMKRLRTVATPLVQAWAQEQPTQERINLRRWIEGTSFQRKFASWYDDQELPWMMDDVPVGSVLLDDPELGAVGHWIQRHKLTPEQQFQRFKSQVAGFVTGVAVNHASLYIGNRDVFHIDKVEGEGTLSGRGVIDTYAVIPGKKVKPLFRSRIMVPHATGAQVDQVVAFARNHGEAMKATASSILGAGLGVRKRGPDYVYDPNEPRLYACSSAIADLYYRAGIDVAVEKGLKLEKVSPADFAGFSTFHSLSEADFAAPDLSLVPENVRHAIYHRVWELMGSPTGPGTENIGERMAYADVARLKRAYHDVQRGVHINRAVLNPPA